MNIIVCIKQVPAKDAPLQIAGNWIREADIGFEMNEPDGFALEEALRLKEKHGGGGGAPAGGAGAGEESRKEGTAKKPGRGRPAAERTVLRRDPVVSGGGLWPRLP